MGWLYLLFAFGAGVVLPFQAGINAQLAHWVDSPIRAAFVSFAVGALALLLVSLLVFKPLPSTGRLGDAPYWVWLGGLLGGFYVLAAAVTAPQLGAATLIAVVVAGQSLASLLVDHYGMVGFPEQHLSAGRIAGMALVVAGVVAVRVF
jgi:transporter family-2 protein